MQNCGHLHLSAVDEAAGLGVLVCKILRGENAEAEGGCLAAYRGPLAGAGLHLCLWALVSNTAYVADF